MRRTKTELLYQLNAAVSLREEMRDEANEARESAREEGNARYRVETALHRLMRGLDLISDELSSPMARLAVRALIAEATERAEL